MSDSHGYHPVASLQGGADETRSGEAAAAAPFNVRAGTRSAPTSSNRGRGRRSTPSLGPVPSRTPKREAPWIAPSIQGTWVGTKQRGGVPPEGLGCELSCGGAMTRAMGQALAGKKKKESTRTKVGAPSTPEPPLRIGRSDGLSTDPTREWRIAAVVEDESTSYTCASSQAIFRVYTTPPTDDERRVQKVRESSKASFYLP